MNEVRQEQINQKVYIYKMPKDKDHRYAVPSHAALHTKSLSLPEKGIISVMMSMNPYEPITINKLLKKCSEHRDTIIAYLISLEKKGLVTKEQIQKTGAIKENHYTLNELNVGKLTDRTFTDRLKSKKKQIQSIDTKGIDNNSDVGKVSARKQPERSTSETIDLTTTSDTPNNINTYNNNYNNEKTIISDVQKQNQELENFAVNEIGLPFNDFYKFCKKHSVEKVRDVLDYWEEIKISKPESPKGYLYTVLKGNCVIGYGIKKIRDDKKESNKITQLQDHKNKWGFMSNIWQRFNSSTEETLKDIVSHIFDRCIEYNLAKTDKSMAEDVAYIRMTNQAAINCKAMLEIKNINEIMVMVHDLAGKKYQPVDTFAKKLNDLKESGISLIDIQSIIENLAIQAGATNG